jgi:hypothetical protein
MKTSVSASRFATAVLLGFVSFFVFGGKASGQTNRVCCDVHRCDSYLGLGCFWDCSIGTDCEPGGGFGRKCLNSTGCEPTTAGGEPGSICGGSAKVCLVTPLCCETYDVALMAVRCESPADPVTCDFLIPPVLGGVTTLELGSCQPDGRCR